jgi:CubicO group peptidase (beta-lactamase class C family)
VAGEVTGAGVVATDLDERLRELMAEHRVPGAALGILVDGRVSVTGAGVLSKATGVDVTPETLFQIGSITKVWTATLVLGLVDEGLLGLDQPVVELLPEFRVSDPVVTRSVTMRHLLTHTSGIDGDVFTDTGRGDDCLERYVAGLADVTQNHPLGATWSYCNSGFVLAGRVVERLLGTTWDAALRERLVEPLGLTATVTLPEDALLRRTAVGHVGEPEDEPVPATTWMLPRSAGPAGLITASAADVLAFAQMHLDGGLAADGARVLSADAAAEMTTAQATLPDPRTLGDSWGLGWIRYGWGDERLLGHDGNTLGQSAFLRVLPARRCAVVLLTNGGRTTDFSRAVLAEVFEGVAGVTPPPPLVPPTEHVDHDPAAYVGRYERASLTSEVFEAEGGLVLRSTTTGPIAELPPEPVHEYPLSPVEAGVYAMRAPGTTTWLAVTFYALDDGSRYVHYGARANPLVGT